MKKYKRKPRDSFALHLVAGSSGIEYVNVPDALKVTGLVWVWSEHLHAVSKLEGYKSRKNIREAWKAFQDDHPILKGDCYEMSIINWERYLKDKRPK